MENFQESIIQHLKTVLREIHWHEAGLENMAFQYVRAEHCRHYSSWDYYDDDYDHYFDDYECDEPYFGEYWGAPLDRYYGRRYQNRFDDQQYSFKCRTSEEDHWDLYTLIKRHGWYIHKYGPNKVFLDKDFYDITPEYLFQKIQEFLVILVMEDG